MNVLPHLGVVILVADAAAATEKKEGMGMDEADHGVHDTGCEGGHVDDDEHEGWW